MAPFVLGSSARSAVLVSWLSTRADDCHFHRPSLFTRVRALLGPLLRSGPTTLELYAATGRVNLGCYWQHSASEELKHGITDAFDNGNYYLSRTELPALV